MPLMNGSVKSIMTSTEPRYGTFTVSSHTGSAIGRSFSAVRQEVDLMNVHGMQFPCCIDNPPMLKRPNFCAHHRSGVWREFVSIDVKALLVFGECHDESRRHFLFRSEERRVGKECRSRWSPD